MADPVANEEPAPAAREANDSAVGAAKAALGMAPPEESKPTTKKKGVAIVRPAEDPSDTDKEAAKKKKKRKPKAKKERPHTPYINRFGKGSAMHGPCDSWGETWPFSYGCSREPVWPVRTTKAQRERGCELFWLRYKEAEREYHHRTATTTALWDVYDACMKGELHFKRQDEAT